VPGEQRLATVSGPPVTFPEITGGTRDYRSF
jgi:hypothetical protein